MRCIDYIRQQGRGGRSASIAAVLLFVTAAVAAASQVTGLAADAETKKPLGFVTVQVIGNTDRGGVINRGAACDAGGRYTIDAVPFGRYILRCSRIGYSTYQDSLIISADRVYRRDVEMTVQPVEVEKIVVEADRFAREKQIQTGFVSIDAEELADLPGIIEGDPIRSLQLLPGVQAASDISSGLYIRGGGPDQTVVLLDGVPVYNPTHAFGFFSTFNADALEEVNLYKGAYPARYGGRLGAVLDVRSADGNRRQFRGEAGISTIAARLTLEGPVANGGTWIVDGRRTYLEPLLNALSTAENPLPSYYFYDFNAKLSSARSERGGLSLSLYLGRDNVDFPLDADSELNLVWGNTLVTAAYGLPISETFLGGLKFAISQYTSDTDVRIFTTPLSVDNRLQDMTFRGDLTWFAGGAHTVTTGLAATVYDVYYVQDFNQDIALDYRRRTYEAAAFVEDEWIFPGGSALRAGLRGRYLGDGGRFLFEPRFSGVRPVSPTVKLKLGAGIYNQYLQLVTTEGFSAADFYVPIDETATPSRSWQSVFGVEWTPEPKYKISVDLYYTGLSDLVVLNTRQQPEPTGLTAAEIFYTGGEGYQTGIELFAERRIGPLTGWIGYTLGWTRRRFDQINQGKTFPPKYDRRNDFNAVAQYRRGKWKYGANIVYATGQAFTPASATWAIGNPITEQVEPQVLAAERNSSRLLPYHRLDVSAARNFVMFNQPAEVYIQVFNLYSRRNDWFVQYNVEGFVVEPAIVRQLPVIPSIGISFQF
ncbi:MAG: TonB-dependent receptor [Candidatus Krumholzibacteria bacterium]|nr:TonB-dependent receptor [Candidatus Krumholzibacteria bacterium]